VVDNRIDELRRRLERDPGSRLFAQLAEEHRKAGDHAEAVRVARGGLALHPGYASARLTLGRALLESGEAGAAAVELAQVVREAPDNILAGRFLGQALEMSGDLAGALQQYTATLKMAPGDRQLEGQIAALRVKSPSEVRPAARPGPGVPPPPPTGPMGAPPMPAAAARPGARPADPPVPPVVARPAAGAPAADAAPAPTIRLPPPVPPLARVAPLPPPAEGRPPAPTAPAADFAERTLMYVPPPTVNVRVEETLRQPPAPASPHPPAGKTDAVPPPAQEAPIEETTLPRHSAAVEAGREATPVVEDSTLPRGRAPDAPTPVEETTLPQRPASDFSHRATPAEPTFADEEPFEDTPAAPAPPAPARQPGPVPVAAEAGWSTDTRSYSAVRREKVHTAVEAPIAPSEGAPAPSPTAAAGTEPTPRSPSTPQGPTADAPLSSSTLAELYLRQGLIERAREVYRQVLADDPGNERAHAGLRDLEAAVARAGPVGERAARRAALQRTIAALETLLGALRRD